MKVPEAELIVELLNNAFASSSGRIRHDRMVAH